MSDHAEYSPSRLKQLLACPGSMLLQKKALKQGRILGRPNAAAEHGTMLHEEIEAILRPIKDLTLCQDQKFLTQQTSHLEKEDQYLVQDAITYFVETLLEDEMYIPYDWDFESQVSLEHVGIPEVYGTCDVWVLCHHKGSENGPWKLHVFDWKFGRYKVLAHQNPQLMAYANGALAAAQKVYPGIQSPEIHVHVVQPKIDNYQSWQYTLQAPWFTSIRKLITQVQEGSAECFPSAETCQWCEVATLCSARMDQVQEDAQAVFTELQTTEDVSLWSDEKITTLLDKLESLDDARKKIKKLVEDRLRAGKEVPGWALTKGQGRRYWADDDAVVQYFDKHFPQVEVFEAKMLSPAALEKQIPAKVRKTDEFQNLITKVHGLKVSRVKVGTKPITPAQDAFKEFK